MRATAKSTKLTRLLAGVIALTAATAWAQPGAGRAPPSAARSPAEIGADVGTGWNILSIPAAAFTARASDVTWNYGGNGYIYQTAGGNEGLWAPVDLPSGAGIGYLNLFGYDSDASFNLTANLQAYNGYGLLPCLLPPNCPPPVAPSTFTVTSVSTSGSSGYQYRSSPLLTPLHTVDNDVVGGGAQYTILILPLQVNGSHGFKGVDIWWKRQISAPPGSASFTDVPSSAQFFAEIEALKASGITQGCTATEFCPDATLTRRQMAAFLARALGLYWQY